MDPTDLAPLSSRNGVPAPSVLIGAMKFLDARCEIKTSEREKTLREAVAWIEQLAKFESAKLLSKGQAKNSRDAGKVLESARRMMNAFELTEHMLDRDMLRDLLDDDPDLLDRYDASRLPALAVVRDIRALLAALFDEAEAEQNGETAEGRFERLTKPATDVRWLDLGSFAQYADDE